MKKIVFSILLLGLSTGYADVDDDAKLQKARLAWSKAYLEKQGHAVPDGGIKIISQEKMPNFKAGNRQLLQYEKDIKKYGYVNERQEEAEQLLTFRIHASEEYKKHASDYKPTDTHLRHNISELKMAYTFVGVPPSEMTENIGVAPYLTYLKGQGWVGAAQFFVKDGIGNCSFSENNTKLSHGAVVIPKKDAREDVNGKVTTVYVAGTKKSGFLYRVEWYDPIFFRTLDCANMEYSEKIKNDVIALATKIDNFQ